MIVTLCGSNRFEPWFKMWNEALSLAGHCVFTTAVYPSFKNGVKDWYTEEEKVILDEVHKKKIDASQAVVILNVFGYIGPSTLSELHHAEKMNRDIFFLESWGKGNGINRSVDYPDMRHQPEIVRLAKTYGIENYGSPLDTSRYNCWPMDLFGPAGPQRSRLVDLVRMLLTDDVPPGSSKSVAR